MFRRAALAGLLSALLTVPALAQGLVGTSQNAAASNATATITVTPPSGRQVVVTYVDAECVTPASAGIALTITDNTAGKTLLVTGIIQPRGLFLGSGLSLPAGDQLKVTLAACGSGVTGDINVVSAIH